MPYSRFPLSLRKSCIRNYESEGRTFESFRARQYLAGVHRAKSYGFLRDLQGGGSWLRLLYSRDDLNLAKVGVEGSSPFARSNLSKSAQ